jgi:hypothetical protein
MMADFEKNTLNVQFAFVDESENSAKKNLKTVFETAKQMMTQKIQSYRQNIISDVLQKLQAFQICCEALNTKENQRDPQFFLGRQINYVVNFPQFEQQWFVTLLSQCFDQCVLSQEEIQKNEIASAVRNFNTFSVIVIMRTNQGIENDLKKAFDLFLKKITKVVDEVVKQL